MSGIWNTKQNIKYVQKLVYETNIESEMYGLSSDVKKRIAEWLDTKA